MRLILASESARRVDLLRQTGYDFEARKSGFPEVTLEGPVETVETNARGKALAVAEAVSGDVPEGIVLGADTIVYLPQDKEIFGQAATPEDVRRMLERLRGRSHEVYSGVAVAAGGGLAVESVCTRVRMSALSDAEVSAYAGLGEGVGKAGGYAIQGLAALFVEEVRGDYSNVVGLPLATTARLLAASGVYWYS